MHNISFNLSQHRVLQSHRVTTLDVHAYLAQFDERVIVSCVCKHLATLAYATKSYTEATNSSVHFLIVENKQMDKELKMTKQGGEQITTSPIVELKRAILNEVSSLEIVMQMLYFRFVTMHKLVIHLNG